MWKSFVLELHGEWSEFADECFALFVTVEISALGNSMDPGDLALPIQIR